MLHGHSMINIIPLNPAIVGEGIALNPDTILDNAKGCFVQVVVVGTTDEGEVEVRSSHSIAEAYMALGVAMAKIVDGRL